MTRFILAFAAGLATAHLIRTNWARTLGAILSRGD